MKKNLFLVLFLAAFSNFLTATALAQKTIEPTLDKILKIRQITNLSWSGPITPATIKYIEIGLTKVNSEGVLLITMNTPGGLVSATKDILSLFGESNVPIIIWVKPEGASATSAGAIISAGAHVLLMSKGSNIGAATPILMSGDIDKQPQKNEPADGQKKNDASSEGGGSDVRKKAVNDLVALMKALATARGRNTEKFAEMVSQASSFEAEEALKLNLIDGIANTQAEVEKNLNQKKISLKGQNFILQTESPVWVDFEMSYSTQWLNVLSHPSMAYVLFLIGAALIYFELQSPGGFVAGSIGVISLFLSGIGFQVLPLNYGAVGLILLSFVLFILEIYVTSYGILTIAGLISLVSGSLFLFQTNDAYISLSYSVIGAAVGGVTVFILIVGYVLIRGRSDQKTDFNDQIGKLAKIVQILEIDGEVKWYQVKVGGEIWKASSSKTYQIGEYVKIKSKEEKELYLLINDVDSSNKETL